MLLLVNKPTNMTSHDVVDFVRKVTGERRVGHGGTLDPMAKGLLIVGVGREYTKKLGEITKNTNKTYIAQITLGEERDTNDKEGKVMNIDKNLKIFSEEEIKNVLKSFIGEQEQTPPIYSAIRISGEKAYSLARKGKPLDMKPRKIVVLRANFISFSSPTITAEFEVSSGTYIRAIARDLGHKLNTYAYLTSLVRTKVGNYSLSDASSLDEIQEKFQKNIPAK